jgi:hypothetical protein
MSNYVDEQTELIKQLTIRHKAYFNVCRQELWAEISVLQDLICDIDYIIGNLVNNEDFFNPRQLKHLKELNEHYLEQLVQTEWELVQIDPPQWNVSTETLQSSSEEESNYIITTTLYVEFPLDPNTLILLNNWAAPNLPAHIEGRVQWVLYQDQQRSAYHGWRLNGSEIPVDFINNE